MSNNIKSKSVDTDSNGSEFIKLIFCICIAIILFNLDSSKAVAQELLQNDISNLRSTSELFGVKGGAGGKVGGGFSKFKEQITNIQRQQLQPLPIVSSQQQSFKAISSSVVQQPAPIIQQTSLAKVEQSATSSQVDESSGFSSSSDSEPAVYGSVSGTPGIDFPNFTSIPNTKFSCDGIPFEPGMYADESTGCQVYHLCYHGRRESFLCGIGTIFNQAILNCDFWSSVECSKSSKYYSLNAEFGKSSSEPGANAALQQQRVSSSSFVSQSKTVLQPPPPVISKTSFVKKESSIINRPASFRVQTSRQQQSNFVSSGKVSPPKQSFGSIEEIQASSNGFVSPGRRLQFQNNNNLNIADLADLAEPQMASGSSNRIKMASSKDDMSMDFAITVTGNDEQQLNSKFSSKKGASSFDKKTNSLGEGNNRVAVLSRPPSPVNNGNSEWRPYFKSNSTGSGPKPTIPTQERSSTSAPAADQEPSFSSENNADQKAASQEVPKAPKSLAPPAELNLSPAPEAPSSASIESDVGPALTPTSPAPFEPANSSQPLVSKDDSRSGVKMESSSPEASESSITKEAPAAADLSSIAPMITTTTSSTASEESSGEKAPTTTTIAPEKSSVEYASSSSVAQEGSGETSAESTKAGENKESSTAESTESTGSPSASATRRKRKSKRQGRSNEAASAAAMANQKKRLRTT